MRRARYVGVMSGTSLDGIDAVVAEFDAGRTCELLGAVFHPFAPALRRELFELQAAGDDELARAARASNALADAYAGAITAVLAQAGIACGDIIAAGVHGQTIRHRPDQGFSVQLNNGARIAERAGVAVVADFRSRDVAAGGQGAPLVPAFHAAMFARPGVHRAVVNIGGIANLTDLPAAGVEGMDGVRGFDVGPGNVLLNLWSERHLSEPFDRDGAWARSGTVDEELLALLRDEPFFSAQPPKSTGRDLFNAGWLDAKIEAKIAAKLAQREQAGSGGGGALAPADVQATLLALTTGVIADAIRTHCAAHGSEIDEVLVCGGGAKNAALMATLAGALAPCRVETTAGAGVAVDHVEALAFAWLAREALAYRPGNLPRVTGAKGLRVLGAIYPR